MADDAGTVEQLRAELQQLRDTNAACRAENATLHDQNRALRAREQSLIDEGERRDRAFAEALEQQAATGLILRAIASSPSDRQEVLETFADQAVIAIENARLFEELERRNRELSEALEHQTATGEVLRIIAGSPTDVQPVLEAVLRNAARLCNASVGVIWQIEGARLRSVVARAGSRRTRSAWSGRSTRRAPSHARRWSGARSRSSTRRPIPTPSRARSRCSGAWVTAPS